MEWTVRRWPESSLRLIYWNEGHDLPVCGGLEGTQSLLEPSVNPGASRYKYGKRRSRRTAENVAEETLIDHIRSVNSFKVHRFRSHAHGSCAMFYGPSYFASRLDFSSLTGSGWELQ